MSSYYLPQWYPGLRQSLSQASGAPSMQPARARGKARPAMSVRSDHSDFRVWRSAGDNLPRMVQRQ